MIGDARLWWMACDNGLMVPYFVAWVGLAVIAVVNGAVREAVFAPRMSSAAAHQLSTVTLLIASAVYFFFVFRRWPPASARHAWLIGAVWLVLTLAFEFGMGYFGGETWPEMLAAYDITRGNLWPLIPLFVAAAPYLYHRTR